MEYVNFYDDAQNIQDLYNESYMDIILSEYKYFSDIINCKKNDILTENVLLEAGNNRLAEIKERVKKFLVELKDRIIAFFKKIADNIKKFLKDPKGYIENKAFEAAKKAIKEKDKQNLEKVLALNLSYFTPESINNLTQKTINDANFICDKFKRIDENTLEILRVRTTKPLLSKNVKLDEEKVIDAIKEIEDFIPSPKLSMKNSENKNSELKNIKRVEIKSENDIDRLYGAYEYINKKYENLSNKIFGIRKEILKIIDDINMELSRIKAENEQQPQISSTVTKVMTTATKSSQKITTIVNTWVHNIEVIRRFNIYTLRKILNIYNPSLQVNQSTNDNGEKEYTSDLKYKGVGPVNAKSSTTENAKILEAYFNEGEKLDKIKQAAKDFSLSDSKNIHTINTRIHEKIKEGKYKFYYITIVDQKTEYMGGGTGFYADTKTINSTVRLYGSDEKLSSNDFIKTGEVKYQYKDSAKQLVRKSTVKIQVNKEDLDSDIRKYIILHVKAK